MRFTKYFSAINKTYGGMPFLDERSFSTMMSIVMLENRIDGISFIRQRYGRNRHDEIAAFANEDARRLREITKGKSPKELFDELVLASAYNQRRRPDKHEDLLKFAK